MLNTFWIIALGVLFVAFPHVVLIYLAVTHRRRKKHPVKLLPASYEERVLFGSRFQ
jgi:hypothetical protein